MDALRHLPDKERAGARLGVAAEAGLAWLERQGKAHGFTPGSVGVDGYETMRVPRDDKKRPVQFSRLEFTGGLTVTDPASFLAALAAGFGRARAFGCGLMLIRRT